jgi:hypothetical protein
MTTAPLSTSLRHRRYVPRSDADENEVRRQVFKLGRNPHEVMREWGYTKTIIDRVCCHAIDWKKWTNVNEAKR